MKGGNSHPSMNTRMIELLSHPNAERPQIVKASKAATSGRTPKNVKTRQGSRSAGHQQPASPRALATAPAGGPHPAKANVFSRPSSADRGKQSKSAYPTLSISASLPDCCFRYDYPDLRVSSHIVGQRDSLRFAVAQAHPLNIDFNLFRWFGRLTRCGAVRTPHLCAVLRRTRCVFQYPHHGIARGGWLSGADVGRSDSEAQP